MSGISPSEFSTEQEEFWAGAFGSEYSMRNRGEALLASNLHFFSQALRAAGPNASCIDFGANIGMNLQALRLLYPDQEQYAIEINADAVADLAAHVPIGNIIQGSLLEFQPARTWDLCLIKGVLIHVHPDNLRSVYQKLVQACGHSYLALCHLAAAVICWRKVAPIYG